MRSGNPRTVTLVNRSSRALRGRRTRFQGAYVRPFDAMMARVTRICNGNDDASPPVKAHESALYAVVGFEYALRSLRLRSLRRGRGWEGEEGREKYFFELRRVAAAKFL